MPHLPSLSLSAVLRLVLFALLCLTASARGAVASAPHRAFDLPADAAERSIKRFSQQAELEVFYPSSVARGLRTRTVRGRMTPREALDAMLAGTGLTVIRDEKTGAFTLKKETASSPGGAAGTKTGWTDGHRRCDAARRISHGSGVSAEACGREDHSFRLRRTGRGGSLART